MKKFFEKNGKYLIVLAVVVLCAAYSVWNGTGETAGTRDGYMQEADTDPGDETTDQGDSGSPEESGGSSDEGGGSSDEGGGSPDADSLFLTFRRPEYLKEHFEKHGAEFDYATQEEYLAGANRVIASEKALYKTEKEDGDHIYYLEDTNEIVFVSQDGYIRTYFRPRDGIKYFNRQ